jgi:hypothetical protein
MATDAQRARLVHLALGLIDHAADVHYSQARPYPKDAKPGHYPIVLDCSSAVTMLCKWAGLHDPNGLHFNGTGYTGTLLDGPCSHYFDPHRAHAGALVVFGPGTGEHVAMVLEPNPHNPLLFSHGWEERPGTQGSPHAIRLHDEAQYHRPPVTFLSIARL